MVRKHAVFGVTLLLSTLFIQAAVVMRPPFGILSLVPFWVCGTLLLLPRTPPVGRIGAMGWMLLVFVLLDVVALLRGYRVGSLDSGLLRYRLASLLTLAIFGVAGFWSRGNVRHAARSIELLWSSIVLFVLINVILLIAGFRADVSTGQGMMLGALGFDTNRVAFVLSRGLNSFGVPAGAVLLVGLMLFPTRLNSRRRLFRSILAVALGMVAVLAVDSRAALVISVTAVILAKLSLRVSWRYVACLPISMPLVLVLIMAGSAVLIANNGAPDGLARESISDIGTLSSRVLIWQPAIAHLTDVEPAHAFGYGSYGQLTSGISRDYVWFEGMNDYAHLSLHNTYLQQVVDTGYVGLGVLLLVMSMGVVRLTRLHKTNPELRADVLLALLIYYVLYGNLEIPATGYHEGFTLFLLLLFFTASPAAHPDSRSLSV